MCAIEPALDALVIVKSFVRHLDLFSSNSERAETQQAWPFLSVFISVILRNACTVYSGESDQAHGIDINRVGMESRILIPDRFYYWMSASTETVLRMSAAFFFRVWDLQKHLFVIIKTPYLTTQMETVQLYSELLKIFSPCICPPLRFYVCVTCVNSLFPRPRRRQFSEGTRKWNLKQQRQTRVVITETLHWNRCFVFKNPFPKPRSLVTTHPLWYNYITWIALGFGVEMATT